MHIISFDKWLTTEYLLTNSVPPLFRFDCHSCALGCPFSEEHLVWQVNVEPAAHELRPH